MLPPTQLSFADLEEPEHDTTGEEDLLLPAYPDGLPPVPPGRLLCQAQAEVRAGRWTADGCRCACCGRKNKVHPRTITRDIALALLTINERVGTAPFYKQDVLRGVGSGSRYEVIMQHYGVLVRCAKPEGATGRKDAWWRLTEKGVAWLERRLRLPRTLLLFNNQFMGYEDESDLISIDEALGNAFEVDAFLQRTPKRPAS